MTIDALILPALFILTHARGRRLAALALCWAGAVLVATAWWLVPLLLQGRYSFNFLPYIEQAPATTGTMSAAAFLRGAGNWTAYLNLGTPWLPAGWAMVTTPAAIIAAAIAAGSGLYGLARRDMPRAAWLRLSAGLAAAVRAGRLRRGRSAGRSISRWITCSTARSRRCAASTSWSRSSRSCWRSGCAHAPRLASLAQSRRAAGRAGRRAAHRRVLAAGLAVTGLVLVGLMLPHLSGQVLNAGLVQRRAALLVSGRRLPGRPRRETRRWSCRPTRTASTCGAIRSTTRWCRWPARRGPSSGLVPYGGAGSQILLQTAEDAIDSGERVPGLAGYLQRADPLRPGAQRPEPGRSATRLRRSSTRRWPGPASPGSPRSGR